MPLPEACAALVAAVCVNGPATISLNQSTVWAGAKISVDELELLATISSDNIQSPDRSRLRKVCQGGECISYTNQCKTDRNGYVCTLYYAGGNEKILKDIEMRAPNKARAEQALSRIWFAPTNRFRIRFTELDYDDGSSLPPICRSRQHC